MSSTVPTLPEITALLARFTSQAAAGASLANFTYTADYRGLRSRASFGMGVRARVPWLGFFGSAAMRPSEEWYPVVLYYRAASALVVAYGLGEACPNQSAWANVSASPVNKVLPKLFNHQPERYGSCLVAGTFSAASDTDFSAVAATVDFVIDRYIELQQLVDVPRSSAPI